MRIVLASTSPRRIEMLRSLKMPFEAMSPDTDETPRRGEKPRELVRRLAREKAASVAARVQGSALVIAADTIVVAPNGRTILGKPTDHGEAFRMLKSLAGRTHVVHTGYCIYPTAGGRRPVCRVVDSNVKIRAMSRGDIERYLATGESMDKAGAYAAQGFGAALVERISGSYMNVVGLPLSQLLRDLEDSFGIAPFSWS